MVPSSSTAIASLLGPVYWIMAKGRFTGLGQGAGLTEGPVYRIIAKGRGLPEWPVYQIIAKGRFTGRAGLPLHGPDWHGGPVYHGGRFNRLGRFIRKGAGLGPV